jgi:hypothetical protein
VLEQIVEQAVATAKTRLEQSPIEEAQITIAALVSPDRAHNAMDYWPLLSVSVNRKGEILFHTAKINQVKNAPLDEAKAQVWRDNRQSLGLTEAPKGVVRAIKHPELYMTPEIRTWVRATAEHLNLLAEQLRNNLK